MIALPVLLVASASCAAARGVVTATSVKSVFAQHENVATYTSVGVSRHAAGSPTFAVAAYLNPPEFVEVFNVDGSLAWTFNNGSATYLVDSARHAEAAGLPIDTFAALITDSGATLSGFSSTGGGTQAWSTTLPGCSTDGGGGTYIGLEAADAGNRVAFLCRFAGAPATARAYALDGQSGAVLWFFDLGPTIQAGQGDIQITADGSWVLFVNENGQPTPNTATAYVLNGATGAQRGANITVPFFITAAISDSGDYVAVGDDGFLHLLAWEADIGAYTDAPTPRLTPPQGAEGWIPWDLQMSTGSDSDEYVICGAISGDVYTVQVTAWGVVNGSQILNWVSATNADKLQENPSLRADGAYIGVSLWGDNGNDPTVVLLKVGAENPVFNFTSPG